MKKILIIIIFFINSCGYQPIYINKDRDSLEFSKISLIGDKDINRKILNSLNISENSSNMLKKELMLETSYKIDETSKNSKGDPSSFVIEISLDLKVFENNKLLITKNFLESFNYNNTSQKFELKQYEEEIKKNLLNNLTENIITFLTNI